MLKEVGLRFGCRGVHIEGWGLCVHVWTHNTTHSLHPCTTTTITTLLPSFLSGVYTAAAERYYKVSAEALRVCEGLVPVLRSDVEEPVDAAMVPIAQVVRRCVCVSKAGGAAAWGWGGG